MEPLSFITGLTYEDDELDLKDAIFQAYFQAFFRHQAYICKLYNMGKIGELQACKRISAAWERLKITQEKLENQAYFKQNKAKNQFYLVNPVDFCLDSKESGSFWN
jgi:hypothetical protein